MTVDAAHLGTADLLDYWLSDGDAARESEVEEHLFACSKCCRALERLVALGDALRNLVRVGGATSALTPAFVDTLKASGLRVNEYRVAPNGSVNCTIAPHDDLVVSRLQAPLQGVQRLDAVIHVVEAGRSARLEDVPFDASSQEVILLPKARELRHWGVATQRVDLISVTEAGDRVLGRYTFNHTPFPV
jgi:anti-sigma factor RsiW